LPQDDKDNPHTGNEMPDTESTKDFMAAEGKKTIARWFYLGLGLIILGILTPWYSYVGAIAKSPQTTERIEKSLVAMQERFDSDFQRVGSQIEDLTSAVNRAAGNDRIIRQQNGLSYVSEPVSVGEQVVLNLVLSRTELGQDCTLLRGQSLFRDDTNIIVAGSEIIPRRQFGREQDRARLVITPPPTLNVGRVELYIALEYDCNDRIVFDKTDSVTYELKP